MEFKIYGPYEIPLAGGEFKGRIDKEDIAEFWTRVYSGIENACGCYVFSIKTTTKTRSKETPWYVGKAKNQTFSAECFTPHKLVHYHDALEKSRGSSGVPMMYFIARFTDKGRMSTPSSSEDGHPEIDFVEQMFIEMGYHKNSDIRNTKGTKTAEKLVIEGFYNHKDRRKKSVKQLYALFRE